jgi:hypothetical protein
MRLEELAPDAAPQRISLRTTHGSRNQYWCCYCRKLGGPGGGRGDEATVAQSLAFGMRKREKRMVFEQLLLLSMDKCMRRKMNALRRVDDGCPSRRRTRNGHTTVNAIAALVDVRNAHATGIPFGIYLLSFSACR